MKKMFGQQVYDNPKTVISEEYSTEYKPGMEHQYYEEHYKGETIRHQLMNIYNRINVLA